MRLKKSDIVELWFIKPLPFLPCYRKLFFMLSVCCVTSLSVSLMVAQSIKMPEEEVLYSNVRFIKAKRETNGESVYSSF